MIDHHKYSNERALVCHNTYLYDIWELGLVKKAFVLFAFHDPVEYEKDGNIRETG
jgi:hypothetical protein